MDDDVVVSRHALHVAPLLATAERRAEVQRVVTPTNGHRRPRRLDPCIGVPASPRTCPGLPGQTRFAA